ncbi:hypothetical protein [Paracoccus sp. IB05]|uniref:hypothetical protein n=1 Tax=Paracoccus sp. IB05 TaxID=2779367 RepID=UPI0018E7B514|nr:hypothetical protein [Paracoccus sp. IB05]MBJ2153984.1 hypothetical protein [Paracoccus sp. IB05]
MTNVIQFPGNHIEIVACIVTAEEVQGAAGIRKISERIGRRVYLVESVNIDGRLCLWDCDTHGEALHRAKGYRREGWGPVIDLCTGMEGRA